MALADAMLPIGHRAVRGQSSRIHEHVAEACRFVGAGHDVRGVHIVTGRRPTFEEIREYQEHAGAHRVRLNVGGTGMISVRPIAREDDS